MASVISKLPVFPRRVLMGAIAATGLILFVAVGVALLVGVAWLLVAAFTWLAGIVTLKVLGFYVLLPLAIIFILYALGADIDRN